MPKIKKRVIHDFKIYIEIEEKAVANEGVYGNYIVMNTDKKEEYYCKNCGSGSCFGC